MRIFTHPTLLQPHRIYSKVRIIYMYICWFVYMLYILRPCYTTLITHTHTRVWRARSFNVKSNKRRAITFWMDDVRVCERSVFRCGVESCAVYGLRDISQYYYMGGWWGWKWGATNIRASSTKIFSQRLNYVWIWTQYTYTGATITNIKRTQWELNLYFRPHTATYTCAYILWSGHQTPPHARNQSSTYTKCIVLKFNKIIFIYMCCHRT